MLNSLKNFIRLLYCSYCKIMLIYFYKVELPIQDAFFPPDYADLYNLWKLMMIRNPTITLEAGSGYSTLIFAQAHSRLNVKNNDAKKVHYCLEQNEKYLKMIKDYVGDKLSKNIIFIKTDLSTIDIAGEKVSILDNFPNIAINLFYEDRTDHPKYPIAGDAFINELQMPDDFAICVDGMRSTVSFYKKNLKRRYKISGRFFHGINFIPL